MHNTSINGCSNKGGKALNTPESTCDILFSIPSEDVFEDDFEDDYWKAFDEGKNPVSCWNEEEETENPDFYWEAWEIAEEWASIEEESAAKEAAEEAMLAQIFAEEQNIAHRRGRAWRIKSDIHHNLNRQRKLQNVGWYTSPESQNKLYDLVNGHISAHDTYGIMSRREAQRTDLAREDRWLRETILAELQDAVTTDGISEEFKKIDIDQADNYMNMPVGDFLEVLFKEDQEVFDAVLRTIFQLSSP